MKLFRRKSAQGAITLNRTCNLEDWQNERLCETIRLLLPDFARDIPGFPKSWEHRKHWEWAHAMVALETLGAIRADGMALGVAAGTESPIYELTRRMRWVHATDIYGTGDFSNLEAQASMLQNPDAFARGPYNRQRLVVQHMNALDLRYEDDTFDVVFSFSSIEHFGGKSGAERAMHEMGRVLKPGGILALTTECIVSGHEHYSTPGLELFSPRTLNQLLRCERKLDLVEEFDASISRATLGTTMQLEKVVEDAHRGHSDYPHVVLELNGRAFTSAAAFLRKRE